MAIAIVATDFHHSPGHYSTKGGRVADEARRVADEARRVAKGLLATA